MGILNPAASLETILNTLEVTYEPEAPPLLFASEVRTAPVNTSPESVVARVWKECLGEEAIPFDPAARKALIADGLRHPELKRHIEAWQKMQSDGSVKSAVPSSRRSNRRGRS